MILFLGLLLHWSSLCQSCLRVVLAAGGIRTAQTAGFHLQVSPKLDTGTNISISSHRTAQPLRTACASDCHDQEPTSATTSRQKCRSPTATFSSAPDLLQQFLVLQNRPAKIFDTTAFCMVGRRAMGLTGGTCSPVRTRPSHNCRDTRGAINAPPTSETNGPTDASLPARDNPAVVSAWASTSLRRPSVATTHRSLENAVVGKAGKRQKTCDAA